MRGMRSLTVDNGQAFLLIGQGDDKRIVRTGGSKIK